MIHTKEFELDVVLLVLLLETFVSLRKGCAFCGHNMGGSIEALRFGGLMTVTAATEGKRNTRADIIIKE